MGMPSNSMAGMEYTGLEGLWGEPEVFAERLKEEIRRELGFTVNKD